MCLRLGSSSNSKLSLALQDLPTHLRRLVLHKVEFNPLCCVVHMQWLIQAAQAQRVLPWQATQSWQAYNAYNLRHELSCLDGGGA